MKRKSKSLKAVNNYAYLFLLPFFITFIIFQLYPMVYSISLSFTDTYAMGAETIKGKVVWFDNYVALWKDPQFWQSIKNTFIIFTMNFIPQLVAALFFAVIFTSTRYKIKSKGLFRFVYFLPNILTAAAVAVLYSNLFEARNGPLWHLFNQLGMVADDKNFFLEAWSSRIIIAFIQFWMWFGNSMVIYIAGIKGINKEIFEAADMDGAGPFKQFFSITFPILKPIMLYSLITSVIGGLSMFDIPMLLNAGGPRLDNGLYATQTITMFIYEKAFGNVYSDYGLASAASVYLFFISLFFSILLNLWLNRDKDKEKMKKRKKVKVHA